MAIHDTRTPLTTIRHARQLLAEIHRVRRTLLMHPSNQELRARCFSDLEATARTCLADGPVTVWLREGQAHVDSELVFSAPAGDDPFESLVDVGIDRITFSIALAAPEKLTALIELLSTRFDDPNESARHVWSAAIDGVEFDYGNQVGFHGARSFTALRLGAIEVTEPSTDLRAAIERETAVDPAVRAASTILDDAEEVSHEELRFLCRVLHRALDAGEVMTATRILSMAERCPALDRETYGGFLSTARKACTPEWWQRIAGAGSVEAHSPLSALILQIGIDRPSADRVLLSQSREAIAAVLQAAPDAPSPELVATVMSRPERTE